VIRIFVGCPANNEDLECQAVLDHSLRKHASEDIEIVWMMLSRDPASFWYADPQANPRRGWNTKTWATPFSALRWGIPAACKFEGRAIYMDSDMIALADIAALWNQPIPDGKALLAKGGSEVISCVMLMDCARMRGVVPPIDELKGVKGAYRHARGKIAHAAANYSGNWNCRDGENYKTIHDPDVKVLHYTAIPTQPNHRHARARLKAEGKPHWFPGPDKPHPRAEVTALFDAMLAESIAAGRGPETFRVSPEFGDYGR
jgi:hypothetical protein